MPHRSESRQSQERPAPNRSDTAESRGMDFELEFVAEFTDVATGTSSWACVSVVDANGRTIWIADGSITVQHNASFAEIGCCAGCLIAA